jgi:hypothetical protein
VKLNQWHFPVHTPHLFQWQEALGRPLAREERRMLSTTNPAHGKGDFGARRRRSSLVGWSLAARRQPHPSSSTPRFTASKQRVSGSGQPRLRLKKRRREEVISAKPVASEEKKRKLGVKRRKRNMILLEIHECRNCTVKAIIF